MCMPVEPSFDEASPMMIDVPVRHAGSDEESDDESLPSVIVAAMENLSVLFSDVRLGSGPRYPGEDFDVEALCASFNRLSIAEMPTFNAYPNNVLVFDGPPSSVGLFTPYHVATISSVVELMVIGAGTSKAHGKASADAVHEVQAIQYFIDGCRDGTLVKHKLMCSKPTSLAVLMAKADKYATADSAMWVKVTASDKVVPTTTTPKPAGDNRGGQNNNKRKADQLDSRSNNKLVANVEGEAPTTQAGSQQRRTNKNDWQPKLSFEHMLDAPCKMHSGVKPSTHTL
ncbi:endoglucanase 3 [Hordeum vulgare]|nr:endoglucanase 3 [Hordeum vulgare]